MSFLYIPIRIRSLQINGVWIWTPVPPNPLLKSSTLKIYRRLKRIRDDRFSSRMDMDGNSQEEEKEEEQNMEPSCRKLKLLKLES